MSMNKLKQSLLRSLLRAAVSGLTIVALSSAAAAQTETTTDTSTETATDEFGGYPEKFKGAGDKEPPLCTLDLPNTATETFFAKWFCTDNFTDQEDIRTELWILKKDAPASVLLGNFLGFPASVEITAGVLGATMFADGLPASFRLVARDRMGNASLSPKVTVSTQDNSSMNKCSLSVITEATESTDENTTGQDSMSVTVTDAAVTSTQSSDTQSTITSTEATASTCQITSICDSATGPVSFTAEVTLDGTTATGSVSVLPGLDSVSTTGTATVTDSVLTSLSLTGSTTVDDVAATLTLTCSK